MTIFKPQWQAILFIVITAATLVILRSPDAERVWLVTAAGYAGFMVVNSVLIWFATKASRYFVISMLVSVLYIFAARAVILIFESSMELDGSDEAAMIFLIVIYHPVMLLGVMLARWVFTKIKGGANL